MSVNLYWRPVKEGRLLSGGTSTDFQKLDLPRRFGPDDLDFLRGYGLNAGEWVDELIEAVDKYGEIDVYGVW